MSNNKQAGVSTKTEELLQQFSHNFPDWKAKYNDFIAIVAEGKVGFFRKINRMDMKAGYTAMNEGGVIAMQESLMADTLIGGNAVLDDDDYFLAAMPEFREHANTRSAELKKY